MFWPIISFGENRKIDVAAGLASKQVPALSTINIPSSTFWKIDENSQSVAESLVCFSMFSPEMPE